MAPRIQDVIRATALHFDIKRDDLRSTSRRRAIVRPRQIGMTVAHLVTKRSLPEIGRVFGNFDHTTVLCAIRRTQAVAQTDETVAADLQAITTLVEANYLDWLNDVPPAARPAAAAMPVPVGGPLQHAIDAPVERLLQASTIFERERFGSGEKRALDRLLDRIGELRLAVARGGTDA